jgi:hypothetical protein
VVFYPGPKTARAAQNPPRGAVNPGPKHARHFFAEKSVPNYQGSSAKPDIKQKLKSLNMGEKITPWVPKKPGRHKAGQAPGTILSSVILK